MRCCFVMIVYPLLGVLLLACSVYIGQQFAAGVAIGAAVATVLGWIGRKS
jgi:hypothetical protein